MNKIGLLKAMQLCKEYSKLDTAARDTLRQQRFDALVAYAKVNSPYYQKLFAALPDSPTLCDLPVVTKPDLMSHWNEWVTDPKVTLSDVNAFMSDRENLGRKLNGKYQVNTTSGSTGNPLVMLCDSTTANVTNGISFCRAYAREEDMKAFISKGGRSIGVYADSGFYLGNGSIHSKLRAFPWKKKQIGIVDALLPTEKIVMRLNEFQPVMLGGYPSNLELLIEEQQSGRLHISPTIIMTGGEYLSPQLREQLSETFGCYVQTSYSCTEGGTIACECREKHLHINDDWLIIEPVDQNNNPVPNGVLADKILLTNLSNYTQPLIRYEVTDRIILHSEPCTCGNPSPWLEIEGRTDDVVSLKQDGRIIRLAPLAIYATLKEEHTLRRFQLVVHSDNRIELRLIPTEGINRAEAFAQASLRLKEFFTAQGVFDYTCILSDEEPKTNPKSGKFKHIIQSAIS
ncbi:MAG: phenylacetate--CoA ligase family protein [Erysipelotrichia bacterium]|nr:phenylacetate--CoA ligase family protein [Erysipelotrichia bacterium]